MVGNGPRFLASLCDGPHPGCDIDVANNKGWKVLVVCEARRKHRHHAVESDALRFRDLVGKSTQPIEIRRVFRCYKPQKKSLPSFVVLYFLSNRTCNLQHGWAIWFELIEFSNESASNAAQVGHIEPHIAHKSKLECCFGVAAGPQAISWTEPPCLSFPLDTSKYPATHTGNISSRWLL